jgi:hypothetical protein
MKHKTIILDATKDDEHLFTLDFLYTPLNHKFVYKWVNEGQHIQIYDVIDTQDVIESLRVTRTLYVQPVNR